MQKQSSFNVGRWVIWSLFALVLAVAMLFATVALATAAGAQSVDNWKSGAGDAVVHGINLGLGQQRTERPGVAFLRATLALAGSPLGAIARARAVGRRGLR